MTLAAFLEAGLLGSLFAAGLLASLPSFEPARRGWLPRFGWILLRYLLPAFALITAVCWCLVPRVR